MTNINRPNSATPEPPFIPPPALAEDAPPLSAAQSPEKIRRRRGKKGGCLPWVIAILVLLTAFAIWKFSSFKAQAELGASYAARVGCSCRYVQGRDINSCTDDFEPGMTLISLTDMPHEKSVMGRAPLLASRIARYEGASGCILLPQQ